MAAAVAGISHKGGTVLGASRGGFDKDKIMEACEKKGASSPAYCHSSSGAVLTLGRCAGINQLYIVGGDGTHRAADALYQEAKKRYLLSRHRRSISLRSRHLACSPCSKLKMAIAGVPKTIDNDIGTID